MIFAKKIVSILLLACILVMAAFGANAEEMNMETDSIMRNFNATNVSREVKDFLKITDTQNVFCVYNVPVLFAFGEYDTIEDILTSHHILQATYIITRDWSYFSQYIITEDLRKVHFSDEFGLCEILADYYGEFTIEMLSDDIEVINTIFLWGGTNHQGTAIYHDTNMGDYVYYQESGFGPKYLFPAKDFFEYMKSLYSQLSSDTPPGASITDPTWDLSKYDIDSDSFAFSDNTVKKENGHAIGRHWPLMVVGACLVIVSGVIVIQYWKKRKKQGDS